MIRVNLLPPEKRRRDRTPISRVATLAVGAIVNAGIIIFMALIGLDTKRLVEDTNTKKQSINLLKPSTESEPGKPPCEFDVVKKQVDRIGARKTALVTLKTERARGGDPESPFLWSEVLDCLCDVIHGNQWVWLTGLDAGEGAGARGAVPLDLYVTLNLNGSASEADCKANRVNEVQTSFKRDLWEKFQVTPGQPLPPGTKRKFPFDWADEVFMIHPHEDPTHKEFLYLDYTATIGRQATKPTPH